jgi:ABC-type dipeptide/oligopeptide/nickel transport system permease subunit
VNETPLTQHRPDHVRAVRSVRSRPVAPASATDPAPPTTNGPAAPRTLARGRRRRPILTLSGFVGLTILGLIVLAAVCGPLIWPHDPLEQAAQRRLQNPSIAHPLGTDQFGRDVLARVLAGARWSLSGALIVCGGTSLLGFAIGAVAASGSRLTDTLLGRTIDALMAIPTLVTALATVTVLGASFPSLLVAMIFTSWPWYARTYRGIILKERSAGYVEGARTIGAGHGRVLLRHMLPNVSGPAIVIATANFGSIILTLATLSFLGLGMQPPTPEWGMMINEARLFFQRLPWQMIGPGLGIALTVLAVNLSGDALRDALDPRSRPR